MISYGELVLTRTPATVTIDTDQPLPEWTFMPLSLLLDTDAVSVHDDGRHVAIGSGWDAATYAIVGWDVQRKALILYHCKHRRIVNGAVV